jgi:Fur family zinc uptake transcriptional regulator
MSLAFDPHDHAACRRDALAAAEALCAERGIRLTPVRRRALEILLEAHEALGAYELLGRLAAEGLGSQPPVAYRALGFLVEQGLAHRMSGGRFVACARPGGPHQPSFLICRICRRVAEAPVAGAALATGAAAQGFAVEDAVIEATGLCLACRGAAPC